MSLHLLTGRPHVGKTEALYRPLIEHCANGGTATLLLPSQAEVVRARLELSCRAPVGLTVTTLDGWISTLWSVHGDGRRIVTPANGALIAAWAAERAAPALRASSGYAGFRLLLADLASRYDGPDRSGDSLTPAAAMIECVHTYREKLKLHGMLEHVEAARILAASPPMVGGPVAVNRFLDLGPHQEEFLIGLSRDGDVTIALAYEDDFPATEALRPQVERLSQAGSRFHETTTRADGELARLEASLFRLQGRGQQTGRVKLVESQGAEAEIVAVASEAARLVANGTPAGNIAVVFRDLVSRHALVDAAFASEGLSVDLEMRLRFTDTPLGKQMIELVHLGLGQAERPREVLSGFMAGPYSAHSTTSATQFDRTWRRSRERDRKRMLREASKGERGSAVEAVMAMDGRPFSASNWKMLADALMAERLKTLEGAAADVRVDAAAHRLVLETLAQVEQSQVEVNSALFASILPTLTVAVPSQNREDAVQVAEAHRIRARRFDAVIVGGLTASEFSPERREPLVTELLRSLGAAPGTDERLKERALFYAIATRAREMLILVRQVIDDQGQSVRASAFWEEVLDVYRSDEEARVGVLPEGSLVVSSATGAAEASVSYSSNRGVLKLAAAEGRLPAPPVLRGTPLDDSLLPSGDREYSATEVEAYISCPYRWFYDRVVRPRAIDSRFDSRERGSLAHSLLARTYSDLRTRGHERVTANNLDHARAVLLEQAERLEEDVNLGLQSLAEKLGWEQVKRWAISVLEQDQVLFPQYSPALEEWSFGEKAGRPFEFAGTRFRGTIDRIDRCPYSIIITDYKSSAAVGRKQFMDHGLLQPIIYAEAAARLLEQPVVAGVYRSLSSGAVRGFWRVDVSEADPVISAADRVNEEEMADLVDSARDMVSDAVEGMSSGLIEPNPSKGACSWCGALSFCKKAER